MKELVKDIEQWIDQYNDHEKNPQKIFVFLMSEFGRLCSQINRPMPNIKVENVIGRCFIVLVLLAKEFKQPQFLEDMEYLDIHPYFEDKNKIAQSLIETSNAFHQFLYESKGKEFEKAGDSFAFSILGLKEVADYFGFDFYGCVCNEFREVKQQSNLLK